MPADTVLVLCPTCGHTHRATHELIAKAREIVLDPERVQKYGDDRVAIMLTNAERCVKR